MPLKNQALTVTYVAWDTTANQGRVGDVANHAIRAVGDGAEFTPAASPLEVDPTNLKGVYKVALAGGEMNYNQVTVGGNSSTAGVVIIPVIMFTDRGVLPTAAPNATNGFVTFGSGAGQLNVASGNVVASSVAGVTFPTNLGALVIDTSGRVQIQYGTATGQSNLALGNLNYAVSVGSGSIGSVTGNVGGNVVGSTGSVAAPVTVGAYSTGFDPATYILATPGNKIAVNSSNQVVSSSVQGNVTGSVGSVVAPVTVGTNNDKVGYFLAAAGLDAIVVEAGINARQALALTMDAVGSGILSNAIGPIITVLDPTGAHNRLVVTTDANGDRTAIVLTPPS
jgi:hypothetical protein